MRRVLRTSSLAAVLVLAASCFVDAPPVQDEGGTTEAACEPGTWGCACSGNGTCQAGLQCDPAVMACIPEDCDPGELACVCANGNCFSPYVCSDGLCIDPDGGSGEAESSAASVDTTAATSLTATTTVDDTSSSTSDDTTTETTTVDTTDTTGDPSCAAAECGECIECVDAQDCQPQFASCYDVEFCLTAVQCLVTCAKTGDCFDDCCQEVAPADIPVVEALVACKSDACAAPCTGTAEFVDCP